MKLLDKFVLQAIQYLNNDGSKGALDLSKRLQAVIEYHKKARERPKPVLITEEKYFALKEKEELSERQEIERLSNPATINKREYIFVKQRLFTAKSIIEEVADKYELTPDDLKGRSRNKEVLIARREAAVRIHRETNLSTTQVGRIFNRDHTTIIYYLKKESEL